MRRFRNTSLRNSRFQAFERPPDEVLITNGCQQSLDLIRQILVEPGEEVALENPTYPGRAQCVLRSELEILQRPVGENGIDLNVLEDVLSQRRAKLIYVVPSFQNPTGVTMDVASPAAG